MRMMYGELAAWWPLLSAPEEYADEAAYFIERLFEAGLPAQPTLLELGSGGGSNALHMKSHFAEVTLSDLSAEMLEVSRALNPECAHIQGDMRTMRLGRQFDVVFVHDAIEYMAVAEDLKAAIATAAAHCKPGGLALFVPDSVRETFEPETECGGHDSEDGRAMRYFEWAHDPDPTDTTYLVDYVFMVRDGAAAPMRVEHERHVMGIYPRAAWLQMLGEAGFTIEVFTDSYERDVFLCRK